MSVPTEMLKSPMEQAQQRHHQFMFPRSSTLPAAATGTGSTAVSGLPPQQQQQKYSRPSIGTIDENFQENNYMDRERLTLNKVTSRDTVSSETTLMEPTHNKNDSYNSISSIDTLCSFKLKRFNSASSIPLVTSLDSMTGSPVSPCSNMSPSPTAASSSLSLKKVAKFKVPPCVKVILNDEACELIKDIDRCLVIDVRPFIEFSGGRLKDSINFNMPSTLLKRANFTLQKCLNNISLVENVKLTNFLQLQREDKCVVFYDDPEVINDEVSLNLLGSVNKFVNDAFDGQLYILQSGFNKFKDQMPQFIETSPAVSQTPASRPLPHGRSLSLANISGSTPISPNLSRFQLPRLPKTPVFKIRHNEEFYDFDNYEIVNEFKHLNYALNHGPSGKLPQWFTALFHKNNTLSLLEKFKNLEIEEKKRINDMILTNSVGSGIELGFKNRYKDIFPYEHSRVKLAMTPTQESHGYINANFINAPHLSNMKYIATQAPLADTTRDFAKLCHDNKISVIVVLTPQFENGVEKCYPYWNDSVNFYVDETVELDELIIRRLKLKEFDESEVLQIQILNWSDYDVMATSQQDDVLKLIYLKNYVLRQMKKLDDNVIVHCSAGCGRTGTFCTLDSIINEDFVGKESQVPTQAQFKQFDPIFEVVESFRNQRISMVQNLRQYLFIYDCLLNFYENFNNFHTDSFEQLKGLDILNHYLSHQMQN